MVNHFRALIVAAAAVISIAPTLTLAAPVMAAPGETQLTGTVGVEHGDNFVTGHDVLYTVLITASGERVNLEGPGVARLVPGSTVRVSGWASPSELYVSSANSVTRIQPAALAQTDAQGAELSTAKHDGTGAKRVAVLLINFDGVVGQRDRHDSISEPWSTQFIRNLYFDGANSVAAFYSEMSNGKSSVKGDVFGWFHLTGQNTISCKYSAWGNAARAAAAKAGIDLSRYTNVAYVFPVMPACWWAGISNVGGPNTWINGVADTVYVAAHELGHNWGIHHASSRTCTASGVPVQYSSNCTSAEYGDPFDVMGAYRSVRLDSGAHRRMLGYLTLADQQTVTRSGLYTIAPVEVSGGSPRIVRTIRTVEGDYYYLEFRQPYGQYDNFLADDPGVNGVFIRIGVDTATAKKTFLLDANPATQEFTDAALKVGQLYSDPINKIWIATRSISPAGAVVWIQLGPDETAPTAVSNVSTALAGADSVTISWIEDSFDNLGVTSYRVKRGGTLIATVAAGISSYTDTSVPQAVSHSYSIEPIDAAGNVGTARKSSAHLPDTRAPIMPGKLSVNSSDAVSADLAWSAATDNVGVSGYLVYRDNVLLGSTTSNTFHDTGPLSLRAYNYSVIAFDRADNSSTALVGSLRTTDNVAPLAPTMIGGAPGETSMVLDWASSNDPSGISGYELYRDSTLIARPSLGEFLDTGLAPWTAYKYSLRAIDGVGNVSEPAEVTLRTSDLSAPGAPTSVGAVSVGRRSVKITWGAAPDNVGVTIYRIRRNGVQIAIVRALLARSYTDAAAVDGQINTYAVLAVDDAANIGPATSATIMVRDATAPAQPGSLRAVGGSTRVDLSWTASRDNIGVVGYHVSRDQVRIATLRPDSLSYRDDGASKGSHSYLVSAFDDIRNEGSAASASATVGSIDATAPSKITKLKASVSGYRVSLTWTAATDDVEVIGYRVSRSGTLLAQPSSPRLVDDGVAPANYVYSVSAFDAAGNVAAPVTLRVTVRDISAPSAPANFTATPRTGRYVDISWTAATDNVAVVSYKLYRDGKLIATYGADGFSHTNRPAAGKHTYTVTALDGAGNASVAATVSAKARATVSSGVAGTTP